MRIVATINKTRVGIISGHVYDAELCEHTTDVMAISKEDDRVVMFPGEYVVLKDASSKRRGWNWKLIRTYLIKA